MNTSNVRWGIAGLGNIAQRFAVALTQHCDHGELYAVAARSIDRADTFRTTFGAEKGYGSYQELAEDPDVDAIYIATVHPYHRALTELFLRHGKHVLVEKPAFTNLADWLAMKTLAHAQGLLLLEAMKTVTFPAYLELKRYLKEHALQVTKIDVAFGNHHNYDPDLFIFNSALAGGATLDVGVYGLWLYFDLCDCLGVEPAEPLFTAVAELNECQVDTRSQFQLQGAIQGTIHTSIVEDLPRSATLCGDDFTVVIAEKWWNPTHIEIHRLGKVTSLFSPPEGNGFEFEIDHFSELVLQSKLDSELIPQRITEQVLTTVERALTHAGFAHLTRCNEQENKHEKPQT
ncbi:Gfo/Idh/MocA family oxidoreductase [Vibrio tubiashii]|nr:MULTISPECIES: Gfo/Idh/MocA family oxidoreductase [Vibrio oreintalis group]MCG9617354.1 Gfo/Idh/MocA family oxidoreductase [Vibrio tubiashii]MCG9686093.1 Gfo/Idh/MocA family oxidoreductase [Vibrio tubiashii]